MTNGIQQQQWSRCGGGGWMQASRQAYQRILLSMSMSMRMRGGKPPIREFVAHGPCGV